MGATFRRYWDRTIDAPRVLVCDESLVMVTTQTWWSSTVKLSATRTGSCQGSTVTKVPSRTRLVCPAMHDSTIICSDVSW